MSTDTTTGTTRADYIAGLHALADALEANPGLKLPYHGQSHIPMAVSLSYEHSQRDRLAEWTRAIPGQKTKNADDRFTVTGTFHGLHIRLSANRDEVCEKVIIGTRVVIEMVPDPALVALIAEVPLVPRTRTVEIVEWECAPLLGDVPELTVAGAR